MSAMARKETLFDQVGAALQTRGHWIFEPSSTPGVAPTWCLDREGSLVLAVEVDGRAITVYLPDEDKEIPVDGLDGLLAWVDENQARFVR